MIIKVLTFNIHHGKGTDGKLDLNRIAAIIEQSDADIIGLNEVDKFFSKRSLFEDQSGWLASRLMMNFAYGPSLSIQANRQLKVREYGNVLLSRFPILLKNVHLFNANSRLLETRSLLDTTVQIHDQVVQVFVTHLSLNPLFQLKQREFILNQPRSTSTPIIIMGDWNMRPGSKGWRQLTKEFQDVWDVCGNGPGYTYPSIWPRSRLDYIFVSQHIKILDVDVITSARKASDHLPLVTTLQL